ncbi:metallophosphoesterase [Shouchella sp. JSM 1781072]|uniref:metallophosphoesterase family protein n=1 Tax=Bacillaceae TaxID=186817 RepID=UPI000C08D152|nr:MULTISPECIES: metallophosphoesterase family protein [Bacillaceae]UTR08336.1 metallophosphatase family protein [Alkalihalobacillus sp. LMS6]
MRFAFLSDIHGNATALEAVLNDLQTQQIDEIYILGDLCFRGPEPKRVIELIQGSGAKVLKGNADEWLIRGFKDGEIPKERLDLFQKERDWTLSRLDQEDLDYLKNLPTEFVIDDGQDLIVHAFHATPSSLFDVVPLDDSSKIENEIMIRDEADIYIYGHTHHPYVRSIHGKNVVNTGSVGMPFDGHPLSSYIIIDIEDGNHSIQLKRVPYNREHVVEIYKQSGYPNIEEMGAVIYYAVQPK